MSTDAIRDRTAVVTGSTKGIGLACAEALLDAGAQVVISARNSREVEEVAGRLSTAHKGRVASATCDVRLESDVVALFECADRTFGSVDILVNNAGVGLHKNLADTTLDEWNTVIETNVTGVFLCSRAAISRMRKRGGGYIINLSSLAGRNTFPGATAYNASKFALNGMSEALMQEVRHDGIRVSAIMPGSVNTWFGGGPPDPSQSWKLTPEDIARVVVDLLRHDPRSLPSAVEIRPSRPPKKG
jgi:NAD(P)-dependent dehydrogenase (short-subunit alcohol dehydrogenase family)